MADKPVVFAVRANLRGMRNEAQQFLADSAAFRALPSPTNAQTLAQVKRISRAVELLVKVVGEELT